MVQYTDLQKKIAMLLLHEPKTAEALAKHLNISYDQLMAELKHLLKLNVVERFGFPTKYKLKEEISSELKRRREVQEKDTNKVRLRAIIEAKAMNEKKLEELLGNVAGLIQKDKEFQVYEVKQEKPLKHGEYYTSFIEVNFSLADFSSITKFIFYYSPSSLEVVKPPKFEVTASELQDALITMIDMVQGYSEYILKQMNKEELGEFTKKLYQKIK